MDQFTVGGKRNVSVFRNSLDRMTGERNRTLTCRATTPEAAHEIVVALAFAEQRKNDEVDPLFPRHHRLGLSVVFRQPNGEEFRVLDPFDTVNGHTMDTIAGALDAAYARGRRDGQSAFAQQHLSRAVAREDRGSLRLDVPGDGTPVTPMDPGDVVEGAPADQIPWGLDPEKVQEKGPDLLAWLDEQDETPTAYFLRGLGPVVWLTRPWGAVDAVGTAATMEEGQSLCAELNLWVTDSYPEYKALRYAVVHQRRQDTTVWCVAKEYTSDPEGDRQQLWGCASQGDAWAFHAELTRWVEGYNQNTHLDEDTPEEVEQATNDLLATLSEHQKIEQRLSKLEQAVIRIYADEVDPWEPQEEVSLPDALALLGQAIETAMRKRSDQ